MNTNITEKFALLSTPEALLNFMNQNICYGWLECDGTVNTSNMNDFRRRFRISSLEQCLNDGFGTCIEQVHLMHTALDLMQIPNTMYCSRIHEPDDYGNYEEEEHMHCFLIYHYQNQVYHIEHPATKHIGIFPYETEPAAVHAIEAHYQSLRGGIKGPTTIFTEVEPGLTFSEFNAYINSLEEYLL